MRTLALIGEIAFYIQPDGVVVWLNAKNLCGEVHFTTCLFAAILYNRYVHHFCRIIVEFLAPGTEPLIKIKFWSAMIFTTFRLRTFTRSLPIRPGRRFPLITREANEALPIDPGARRRLCWPCVWTPTPAKP